MPNIFYCLKFVFLFQLCVNFVKSTPEDPELTFEHLYRYGKNDYTRGNWADCVAFLLRALDDFRYFQEETLWCRQYCGKIAMKVDDLAQGNAQKNDWMTTNVMYTETQRALCLLKCKQDKFTPQRPQLKEYEVLEDFLRRKPYHYLQFCYWKLDDLKNAVKNAYTYLIANPKDEMTLENINFYMEQKDFNRETMLVDMLQPPFERLYMEGVNAYDASDWNKCINKFERALDDFYTEENKCRLFCEDHLDWSSIQASTPELSIVLASFYTSFIRCRYACFDKLSKLNGREVPHFLASFFEYMHVCQFRANRGRDACQSVSSSILLNPKNALMRRNKLFYLKSYEKDELFQAYPEILELFKKRELERRFLAFVDENFQYYENELRPAHVDDRRVMDLEVDVADNFDYSRLEEPVIQSSAECKQLLHAASVPLPKRYFRHLYTLIDELERRISDIYGDAPKFKELSCTDREEPIKQSGCYRAAFIIRVGETECGAILADPFEGCSIIFCIE